VGIGSEEPWLAVAIAMVGGRLLDIVKLNPTHAMLRGLKYYSGSFKENEIAKVRSDAQKEPVDSTKLSKVAKRKADRRAEREAQTEEPVGGPKIYQELLDDAHIRFAFIPEAVMAQLGTSAKISQLAMIQPASLQAKLGYEPHLSYSTVDFMNKVFVMLFLNFVGGEAIACRKGRGHHHLQIGAMCLLISAASWLLLEPVLLKSWAQIDKRLSLFFGLIGGVMAMLLLHMPLELLRFPLTEGYAQLCEVGDAWLQANGFALEVSSLLSATAVRIYLGISCAAFTCLNVMPAFRFARVRQRLFQAEETSSITKWLLSAEVWGWGVLALLWLQPLIDIALSKQLRPCHAKAPHRACFETGSEGSLPEGDITEGDVGMLRFWCCMGIVMLRAGLFRTYLQGHLDAAKDCVAALSVPTIPAAEVNALLQQPFKNLHYAVLHYVCPLFWFVALLFLFKMAGSYSIGICPLVRHLVGASAPYCAAGPDAATTAGVSIFWAPVWSFAVFWACLSNFVTAIMASVWWAQRAVTS